MKKLRIQLAAAISLLFCAWAPVAAERRAAPDHLSEQDRQLFDRASTGDARAVASELSELRPENGKGDKERKGDSPARLLRRAERLAVLSFELNAAGEDLSARELATRGVELLDRAGLGEPKDAAEALFLKGTLQEILGDGFAARESFRQALLLDPSNGRALAAIAKYQEPDLSDLSAAELVAREEGF